MPPRPTDPTLTPAPARAIDGKRTPDRVAKFLEVLAETARVTVAAEAIKVHRSTVYAWRKEDPEFAKAWDAAEALAVDVLEEAAIARALEGGSDRLLIMLLRAKRPERYREKVDLGGAVSLNFK